MPKYKVVREMNYVGVSEGSIVANDPEDALARALKKNHEQKWWLRNSLERPFEYHNQNDVTFCGGRLVIVEIDGDVALLEEELG